jgi:hypothetical protein
MLAVKIVVTFLLLWLAARVVSLVFNSRPPRGLLTSLTVGCAATLAYMMWYA